MVATAPSTEVDICNLALEYLGERAISSIDSPTTPVEDVMARWYHHVRQVCLREYVWNFAQAYATLSSAGTGSGGYSDYYTLPSGCLRINALGEDPDNPITDYQIVGRNIHVDKETTLDIRYTDNVTTVATMDVLFINIFALRLALKVAYKFAKKKSLLDMLNSMLAIEEVKAISVDGQERPPRRIQKSKYLTARRGGGSSRNSRYYDIV